MRRVVNRLELPIIRDGGERSVGQAKMTSKRWRQFAHEALMLAAELNDPLGRSEVLKIAQTYEHLAQRAERSEETG